MGRALVVDAGDMHIDELMAALEEGRRVVVRTTFLGSSHEVTLRWDGDTYYCDTPTRLHKHDSEAEMRTCIENHGYCRTDDERDAVDPE